MNYYLKVLKQYADFKGRARRSEYWYFVLFNSIIFYILLYIGRTYDFPLLGMIYYIGFLIPFFAVAVRRMHDVGKSGWYCLIPIYGFILSVTDGDEGTNQYGPDPKSSSKLVADNVLDA